MLDVGIGWLDLDESAEICEFLLHDAALGAAFVANEGRFDDLREAVASCAARSRATTSSGVAEIQRELISGVSGQESAVDDAGEDSIV